MTIDISKFQKEKTFEDFLHVILKDFVFLIAPILLLLPIGVIATKGIKPMFQSTASMYATWGSNHWKGRIISSVIQEKEAPINFLNDLSSTLEKSKKRFLDPEFSDETISIINKLIPDDSEKDKIIDAYLQFVKSPKAPKDAGISKITITCSTYKNAKEKGKRFFIIDTQHREKTLCLKSANVFLSTIKEYFQRIYNQKRTMRSTYMKRQLVYYKKKYDVARTVLSRYSKSKEMVFSEARYRRIKEILGFDPGVRIDNISYDKFKGDLIDLNLELKTLRTRKKEIETELSEVEEYIVSEIIGEEDPQIAVLKEKLSEKNLLIAKLSIDSSSLHPLVKQTKKEIQNIESLIELVTKDIEIRESKTVNPTYENLKKRLSDVNAELSTAKARIELNQLTFDDMSEKLEATKMVRSRIESLTRDVKETERLYKSFEAKVREEALVTSLSEEDASYSMVMQLAKKSKNLLIKKRINIFAKYFFIGILIGIGLLYTRNVRDTSYRTALELRKDLQIPVFGSTSLIINKDELVKMKKIWKITSIGYAVYVGIAMLIMLF